MLTKAKDIAVVWGWLAGIAGLFIAAGGLIMNAKAVPVIREDISVLKQDMATSKANRVNDDNRLNRMEGKLDDMMLYMGMNPDRRTRR